jgi:hypothetical protein
LRTLIIQSVTLFLASVPFCFKAAPQVTQNEFAPEIDGHFHLNEKTRVSLLASYNGDPDTQSPETDYGAYLELALRPLFRPVREDGDVFAKRFFTFRTGFRYITTLPGSRNPSLEHRWSAEMTWRFPLPGSLILTDQNSGDFRFINNSPFSIRYCNKLQLERDFRFRPFVLIPYVNGELDYDTRYSSWYRNRYAIGTQLPLGKHLILETYVMRQNQSHSSLQHLNKLGLNLNFYF